MKDEYICAMCEKTTFCPSILTFNCSYGSVHDGEKIQVSLCGDCADELINSMSADHYKPVEPESDGKVVNIFNYYLGGANAENNISR